MPLKLVFFFFSLATGFGYGRTVDGPFFLLLRPLECWTDSASPTPVGGRLGPRPS